MSKKWGIDPTQHSLAGLPNFGNLASDFNVTYFEMRTKSSQQCALDNMHMPSFCNNLIIIKQCR